MKKAWQTAISKAGATILEHEGNSTLVLKCPSKKVVQAVKEHAAVSDVREFAPDIKIGGDFFQSLHTTDNAVTEQTVAEAAAALASGGIKVKTGRQQSVPGALVAQFFTDQDARKAQKSLSSQGVRTSLVKDSLRLVVDLSSANEARDAFVSLVQRPGLKRVEPLALRRLFNDVARNIVADGVVNANPPASRLPPVPPPTLLERIGCGVLTLLIMSGGGSLGVYFGRWSASEES